VIKAMKEMKLPPHTLFNLNAPDVPLAKVKGVKLARQGFRFYSGDILKRRDHRGKDYFWVGGKYQGYREEKGTDCTAVAEGYASLTPIKLDSTDFQSMAALGFGSHDRDADLFLGPSGKKLNRSARGVHDLVSQHSRHRKKRG
jgi:5'-nucleotidase